MVFAIVGFKTEVEPGGVTDGETRCTGKPPDDFTPAGNYRLHQSPAALHCSSYLEHGVVFCVVVVGRGAIP